MNILGTIFAPFVAIGVAIGSLFAPPPEPQLGASEAIPVVVAFFETTLQSPISSSATSFTLTSATDKDGNTLASSTYAFVIDEGSANEEIVIADCTGTACTNALRGISVLTGNTEVAALKKSHRRGSSVKITDAPILMLVSRLLRGEDILDMTPQGNGSLVTKQYVDALALGSAAVSSTYTDDGIVELATATEAASSTATGQSGSPLTLHTGISTSSAPTSGSYVVITGTDGNIAEGFIGDFSSSTSLKVGDTPILAIGTYFWSTTTAGTSTWSVPTGITKIKVTVVGAGGDGGLAQDTDSCVGDCAGGGGGGGGTSIKWIDVSSTSTIQFHVATDDTDYSWFMSTTTMLANSGGDGLNGRGGAGGTALYGHLNIPGSGGGVGSWKNYGGTGGDSFLGGGIANTSSGTDNDGTFCGVGGSGEGADNGAPSTGGAGYVGCILIEY